MKEFTIYSKLTGQILRTGQCQAIDFEYQAQVNEDILEGIFDQTNSYVVCDEIEGKELKAAVPAEKTAKPGVHYNWDYSTKTWVGDLATAKANTKAKIIDLFKSKDNTIITYDNKQLDADQSAKDAIIKKLAELEARDAGADPEASHIWRDANNTTHSWVSLIVYKLWLKRLLIAISTRTTTLKVTAWAHKDAIEALTSVSDIENYNYEADW
jgi:hypothetical protein